MRFILLAGFCSILWLGSFAQQKADTAAVNDIVRFQQELNAAYKDSAHSPLSGNSLKEFKGHDFFAIDLRYRVLARFERTQNAIPFEMPTTSGKTSTYEECGKLYFFINDTPFVLKVYQSHRLRKTKEYADYLFLPFSDKTNGVDSYGGGRYIDMRIPNADEVIIDFNKAYNPYCAYATGYNCPKVPEENRLDIKIPAGIRLVARH